MQILPTKEDIIIFKQYFSLFNSLVTFNVFLIKVI